MLLLVTYRPEFSSKWSGQSHVTTLTLNRLTKKQTADLVKRVALETTLPNDLLEQISAKTDGIPLFVEELTKVIIERGSGAEITIPATLKDSLMARLDRLGAVKEIAQIGACIGREFGYRLLTLVTSMETAHLDRGLAQLAETQLLFQRGTSPDATFSFKHALIQDVAYDSLLKSRRIQIHARIAEVIEEHFPDTKQSEPELVARHLTEAGLYDRAIPHWHRAGELAIVRLALKEAIAHFEHGVDLIGRVADCSMRDSLELDLRAALGIAWMLLSGWAHAQVSAES